MTNDDAPYKDEELLREKYMHSDLAIDEICDHFGCSRNTLYYWLNKYGLQEEKEAQRERPWRDEETLRELYIEQEMTMAEVADELDCSAPAVDRNLKKNGIETRTLGGKDRDAEWKDKEVLEELYHEKGLSTYQIADRYDVVQPAIHKKMQELGIETRKENKDRVLSPHLNPNGYEVVAASHKGTKYWVFIHQLVAIAGGADPYKVFGDLTHVVHHKNELSWDNRPKNVELITQKEHREIHGNQYTD